MHLDWGDTEGLRYGALLSDEVLPFYHFPWEFLSVPFLPVHNMDTCSVSATEDTTSSLSIARSTHICIMGTDLVFRIQPDRIGLHDSFAMCKEMRAIYSVRDRRVSTSEFTPRASTEIPQGSDPCHVLSRGHARTWFGLNILDKVFLEKSILLPITLHQHGTSSPIEDVLGLLISRSITSSECLRLSNVFQYCNRGESHAFRCAIYREHMNFLSVLNVSHIPDIGRDLYCFGERSSAWRFSMPSVAVKKSEATRKIYCKGGCIFVSFQDTEKTEMIQNPVQLYERLQPDDGGSRNSFDLGAIPVLAAMGDVCRRQAEFLHRFTFSSDLWSCNSGPYFCRKNIAQVAMSVPTFSVILREYLAQASRTMFFSELDSFHQICFPTTCLPSSVTCNTLALSAEKKCLLSAGMAVAYIQRLSTFCLTLTTRKALNLPPVIGERSTTPNYRIPRLLVSPMDNLHLQSLLAARHSYSCPADLPCGVIRWFTKPLGLGGAAWGSQSYATSYVITGPSGHGKSHFVRDVAASLCAVVTEIRLQSLFSSSYGLAQKTIRRSFHLAWTSKRPCIILLENIDILLLSLCRGELVEGVLQCLIGEINALPLRTSNVRPRIVVLMTSRRRVNVSLSSMGLKGIGRCIGPPMPEFQLFKINLGSIVGQFHFDLGPLQFLLQSLIKMHADLLACHDELRANRNPSLIFPRSHTLLEVNLLLRLRSLIACCRPSLGCGLSSEIPSQVQHKFRAYMAATRKILKSPSVAPLKKGASWHRGSACHFDIWIPPLVLPLCSRNALAATV